MKHNPIPITPELVTWARKRAGYTLEDAVEKLKLKKIEQWEDAATSDFPSYPQLEKMADAFKVPIAVFFFPEPPDLPSISETFRTLGSEQFELIPPRVRLLLRKARAFQISLAELNNGQNPADRLIIRDLSFEPKVSIDTIAKRVREYLGIPLDLPLKIGDMLSSAPVSTSLRTSFAGMISQGFVCTTTNSRSSM
jgi:transcriptional regulator with XRE-family HTH domain